MKVMFSQSCLSVIPVIGKSHGNTPSRTTWTLETYLALPHHRICSNLTTSGPSFFPKTSSIFSLGDPAPGLTSKRVVGLRLNDLLVQHRNTVLALGTWLAQSLSMNSQASGPLTSSLAKGVRSTTPTLLYTMSTSLSTGSCQLVRLNDGLYPASSPGKANQCGCSHPVKYSKDFHYNKW